MKNFFFSFFLISPLVFQAQGIWTQKANFGGSERSDAVAFTIGNKAYLGTGMAISATPVKDVWQWIQGNGAWTMAAAVSTVDRYAACGFAIGPYGYIMGGGAGGSSGFLKDLWEIDFPSYSASEKASIPDTFRVFSIAFSIGTKGYVGLGMHGGKTFWAWDQATDAWTQMADFGGATPRIRTVAFTIGNKGYVGTGDVGGVYKKDFWEYDAASNTWVQKADFPGTARFGAAGFSISGCGFLGTGWDGNWKKDFWRWEQATDQWVQMADLPPAIGRRDACGFAMLTKGYIACGYSNYQYMKDVWEYVPALPLSPGTASGNSTCTGSCNGWISLGTSGGTSPYTYLWSSGQTTALGTGLCPGSYTITVKDAASASVTVTVAIAQGPPLADTLAAVNASSCSAADGSVTASPSGGAAPFKYLWSTSATTSAITALVPGTYSVTITDVKGCTYQTAAVVSCPNAVSDHPDARGVIISSDLFAGNFLIRSEEKMCSVEVLDILGEKIRSFPVNSFMAEFSLIAAKPGIYFLAIRRERDVVVKKILLR